MEWLATAFAFLFLWSTVLGTDYTAGQDDGFVAFVVRKKSMARENKQDRSNLDYIVLSYIY
jgi:hypothetical protein